MGLLRAKNPRSCILFNKKPRHQDNGGAEEYGKGKSELILLTVAVVLCNVVYIFITTA